jgi:hypothetical protein
MNLALAVVYDNFKKRKLEEHTKEEAMKRMRIETRVSIKWRCHNLCRTVFGVERAKTSCTAVSFATF